ncbi:TPA: oligosaccharide flippase family protein [Klebsiella quasipneumoniae subsp. similipneumoniae]|uniref:oligosaccharide flippase family protein n=1 Tax=Klebsiella quasipneumoniae TaxID=1463165 RepID=UPI00237E2F9A|nr:oligosaccharide flippase family protein [Klebsiella quasipneumoniae]MDL2151102.1 oligosaccharide flippase family protein [Klebsiella quasipneumoniae]MDW2823155.1 oligosaccharide flippase family protein [Klebsiella quasipneumoniae]HDT1828690.1 oligosaccharide flippase family protein [Klebsiella quasipneumoniae subsp. similipneumoniae]
MSQVKKNIVWLTITQISSYVFPLLTLPYLIRVLGMNVYGVYAIVLAFSQYLLLLVDFGYNLTATREVALVKEDKIELSKVFWTTMLSKLFLCILGFVSTITVIFFYNTQFILLSVVAYFSVLGNAFFPVWLYQGLEKMRFLSIVSVISRSIVLLCTFIFVKNPYDLNYAVIVYGLTYIVPSIILNFNIWKQKLIVLYIPSFVEVYNSLKISFPIFVSNFAISFYTNFNSILLSKYESISVVGSYYSADRVRIAAQTLLSPISQAIYPRVCDSQKKKKNKELLKFGFRFVLVGVFISIGVAIFSFTFSNMYFGHENTYAPKFLMMMSPIIGIVSIAMVFGHWFMAGNGYNRQLSYLYASCSILHLCYSIPLVNIFGVQGLIFSSIMTQLLIALIMILFYLRKRIMK